jgi:hypothetical protein
MFALYYQQDDGCMTWIASCQDVRSARNVAQVYSTGKLDAVVCVYNGADGTTRRSCVFRNGQEAAAAFPIDGPPKAGGGESRV